MSRLARLGGLVAALSGCYLDETGPYRCLPRPVLIERRAVDFEGFCPGDTCNVTTVGSTAVVPSLLPGDHALALDPGAAATWRWAMRGNSEGTSMTLNFRCDEGGALRVVGAGDIAAITADLAATRDWTRRAWRVRPAATEFETEAEARAGSYEAVVRVENTGRARCAIDWLHFQAAPLVCASGGRCQPGFSGSPRTRCGDLCVDTMVHPEHCGVCGRRCGFGTWCAQGRCVPGSEQCPGACDERECGPAPFCSQVNCGTCPGAQACSNGRCVPRDGGLDAGPPWSRADVVAGRRCRADADCRTPSADLTCVATTGGRVCTLRAGCTQRPVFPAQECGGRDSTCLPYAPAGDPAPVGLCTRACIPFTSSEAGGACPPGSVCTTHWIVGPSSSRDVPGCLPFCRNDADCADPTGSDGGAADGGAPVCHVRTGRCVSSPPSPLAAEDGAPCNPVLAAAGADPCRGTCLLLDATRPTEGLCASFLDLGRGSQCERPGMLPRGRADDNLAVCAITECGRNDGCPAGLVCVYPEDRSRTPYVVRSELAATCAYPTALQPNGIPGDAGVPRDAGLD